MPIPGLNLAAHADPGFRQHKAPKIPISGARPAPAPERRNVYSGIEARILGRALSLFPPADTPAWEPEVPSQVRNEAGASLRGREGAKSSRQLRSRKGLL